MPRTSAGLAALLAVCATLIGACGRQPEETVAAQQPPGTACEWSHSPAEGPPGTPITFTGVARFGDATMTAIPLVTLRGSTYQFGDAEPQFTDAAGNFTRVLRVPVDAPPGDYGVRLSCTAGDQVVSGNPEEAGFTVLQGPPITTTSTTIPVSPTTTILSRTG